MRKFFWKIYARNQLGQEHSSDPKYLCIQQFFPWYYLLNLKFCSFSEFGVPLLTDELLEWLYVGCLINLTH